MSKLLQFSAILIATAITSFTASADVVDKLSDLKVTVKIEEEPFAGEAYSVFTTDKCSAFAIQQAPDDTMIDPMEKPKQRPVQKPPTQKPGPSLGQGEAASDLVKDLTDLDTVLTAIEKIGTRIWTIIERNRPVVSVESKVANALPKNVDCWMDLENWQMPKSYKYNVKYTNLFGMDVVNYTFRIVYTYGASYEGRGKYLSNVSVHPANLDVAWGYTFNSKVEVQRLINLGSKEDPIAGMDMKLWWQISTPIKDSQATESFFVTGHGEIHRN